MAAKNMNTEFVNANLKGKRVRTSFLRGSLLHTSIHTKELFNPGTSDWPKADATSILYVCLIPFTASIKSIKLATDTDQAESLTLNIGIAGIKNGNYFETIKANILEVAGKAVDAKTFKEIWSPELCHKTLFEMLHDDNKNPIEEFKPYTDDKYGVLMFTVTAPDGTNIPTESFIEIDWVEQAPSSTSPLSMIVSNSVPHSEAA